MAVGIDDGFTVGRSVGTVVGIEGYILGNVDGLCEG